MFLQKIPTNWVGYIVLVLAVVTGMTTGARNRSGVAAGKIAHNLQVTLELGQGWMLDFV